MKRALSIISLLSIPWMLAWLVPPITNEFKFREFGITQYPGWSDTQLWSVGAAVAVVSFGSEFCAMWLFYRLPPPLRGPRVLTWTVAFLLFGEQVLSHIFQGVYISAGSIAGVLGIYFLFALPPFRFWRMSGESPKHFEPPPSKGADTTSSEEA